MKKILLIAGLIFGLLASTTAQAEVFNLVKATGRAYTRQKIKDQNLYGWGKSTVWVTSNDAAKNRTYLIGAGHAFAAAKDIKSIWVQFFYPELSDFIEAKIEKVRFNGPTNEDMALISIPTDKLPEGVTLLPLKVVEPKTKMRVLSYGAQAGEWPSLIFGSVFELSSDGFIIDAHVQPGRSGSVVTDETGENVLGMILRQSNPTKKGECTSAEQIKKWLDSLQVE